MIFSYHAVPAEEEMFFIGRALSSCLSLGAEQCGSNARPPHPEHIGDIMLTFRSIRMWKNICEALHDETTALNKIGAAVFTMHLVI